MGLLDELQIEYNLTAVATQPKDGDDGGDDYQEMRLESRDCGGGPYFIIKTERWAFDKPEEVAKVLQEVTDKFKKLNEEEK